MKKFDAFDWVFIMIMLTFCITMIIEVVKK